MPNQAEIVTETTESDELEEELVEFQPGELVAVDATNDRVELEDDEYGTVDEKENCLKGLGSKCAQRDLTSRRLQIRDAWKARYFYRGNQHLLNYKGTWVMPSQVLAGGQNYDDTTDETNMYLAFGDTIAAALTAGTPSVRFEAEDPTNAADISAAENAEKARLLIERNNDIITINSDIARFLWTDGIAWVYVSHVLDAQRFGFDYSEQDDFSDEISYLPELGGEGPDAKKQAAIAPDGGPQGRGAQDDQALTGSSLGVPRGSEVIRAFGTLEVKAPIQANDIHGSNYVQWSEELDVTTPKAQYPDKASKIQVSTSPSAESEYERLARTSIMMGMRPSNQTNDSMTYNVTVQRTWVRPAMFMEEQDDSLREWLFNTFPKGALIVVAGTTFCECRNESLDDHWTRIDARPGDGAHRPALGGPLIPLQEKLNDCMDLVHESFMHLIPIKWIDSEAIDAGALDEITSRPNTYLKMKRRVDKALAENIYVEPQIQIAEGMLTYIEKIFGEMAQFLCGAFPALFGGNTGSNDTAQGIASQRDQALGRIGLTWRNLRSGYARFIAQSVRCAAEHRKGVMSGTIPGRDGTDMKIALDPNDLKGNILCYPDSDENFPESWVAQRMVWMNLLEKAATNPLIAEILKIPRNQMLAKDKIGVNEISIPGAQATRKQLGEIIILLETGPMPNPKIEQLQQQMQQMVGQGMASGTPPTPEQVMQLQQLEQQLENLPPMVSTVPIGKLDDNENEAAEIKTWASTPEGIRAAATNPQGFSNVELHYDEHVAAAQAAAGNQAPPEKPPSESIAYRDLPPEGQVQLAAKAGIKLDLGAMKAEAAKADAEKAAKLAAAANSGAPPAGESATQ
jgi:hypothetical protein